MVLVVNGSADAEEEGGSGFEPRWQLLTRKNFSTQIRQHEFALLMVTYPWSGESRALRNDLVQLMKYMHSQFQRLRLMLIYRNVEKMLGDVLVGDKAVNLVFYREAVPFKYSGKLSAQTILASVWHAMSIPSGDLPFIQLNTLEVLEFFLQSTDKAVLLFDICGWVPNILAADNKNTRFSTTTKTNHTNLNQEEGLERDGSVAKKSTVGSQLESKSDNDIESVGMNLKRDKNTKISPKSPLMMTENHGFVSEQEICETSEGRSATLVSNWQESDHSSSHALFYGSSCTQEEYNYFKVLYTNLSRIARDNMLPPERQRFGLLSNRTVISALSIDAQQKSLLMLQFSDCPNCSKTFDREDDLEEFLLTPHPLVTELQGEGYKLVPPLSTETASLILFIDRTSLSERLRQRSKAALQEVRQVAFHYLLSYLSDKRKITGGDKILPKTYSSKKAGKKTHSPLSKHVQMQVLQAPELLKWLNSKENKVFQVKAAEGGIQIVPRKIDGSLVSSRDQILNYFLKQDNSGSQLSQDKLGQLAKKAGLQLLSGEFRLDKVQVSHIPETISSLIEKASGQTEEDFKESVNKESLETEEQHQKLGDIMDNLYTHSLTSKHIPDNGNEKQDSGIVVNDMILDPEGYDVKHELSTTQECPARPWQEQCKNELSTNECLDNDSNQGCRTERIEDSRDQVKHLKESVRQETVAEDYVSQKFDVYDQKGILLESGNGEQNQDSTITYAEEMALFEKKEKSTVDVSEDEVTKGDHLKYEPTNRFPSVFQIDCTLNDCSSLLKSSNQEQKELYPALLLFPAGKKDDPIAYEGDISVNDVIEFLASYGSVSNHLYSLRGALWNKMQQGRGSLNACAPWTLSSSSPIQIEAPLHLQRTGPEHLLPISEQYASNQFQEASNGRFSLQKEIQRPTVGSVLVASKNLHGVYPFENSIIIIVKVDLNEGFQGLIVNKPLPWDDLPKNIYMQLEPLLRPTPIYLGGPIIFKDNPFLSLTRIVDLEGFVEVVPGIYYGDPKVTEKIFMLIRVGKVQAHDFCFFLGFTNWGWQQLFDEVAEQAWHFDTYREDVVRWPAHK